MGLVLMAAMAFSGCTGGGNLLPAPGEGFPEEVYHAPLRNYFAHRPLGIFCFESAGGAPGSGREAALILYQALLRQRAFTNLASEIDLGPVSTGRQVEVAEEKGYEFIISGSVTYYFAGGKTRDSRVDQEMRIVSTATGATFWFAGATATGKAVHDRDWLLYVTKGREGPPPEALMAVNAGKFCNLLSWESPRYRDLREDMQLVDTGYNFLQIKQYDAARSYFEAALRVRPKNPYAYLNLGVVCEAQGRVEEAVRMYRKVIELKPDDVIKESTDSTKIGSSLLSLAKDNMIRLGQPPD